MPSVPPYKTQLSVAYTPNNNDSKKFMVGMTNYYGLNIRGFDSENKMQQFLVNKSNKAIGSCEYFHLIN